MVVNANSIVDHVIQIKNGKMIKAKLSVNSIAHGKKDYSWNRSTCICKNSRCLKSIFDDSVILCNYIINFTNSLSTNVTNKT